MKLHDIQLHDTYWHLLLTLENIRLIFFVRSLADDGQKTALNNETTIEGAMQTRFFSSAHAAVMSLSMGRDGSRGP